MRTTSWMVGLGWSDVFGPGNTLSMAVGAPAHVTRLEGLENSGIDDSASLSVWAALLRATLRF